MTTNSLPHLEQLGASCFDIEDCHEVLNSWKVRGREDRAEANVSSIWTPCNVQGSIGRQNEKEMEGGREGGRRKKSMERGAHASHVIKIDEKACALLKDQILLRMVITENVAKLTLQPMNS